MDVPRWRQTRALFDELIELAAETRAERLTAIGAADPDLRAAVESLLIADGGSSGELGAPTLARTPLDSGEGMPDPFGLTGQVVSHFRVLAPLGAGGMGVVYRAEDTRLGRAVALKIPLPRHGLSPSDRARFLLEARAAAALDHPNLCTIHEVGETDGGHLFLAMALYPGETLKARLAREGPLPIGEAVEIARQAAGGLACAHAAGIVHRDLKPGNLMLLPDGTVRILDFGLAKSSDTSLTGSGATLGTVAYMAPEQIQGGKADGRTDLWALGVVLYEMLTGRRPFFAEHEHAIAHAIVYDEPISAAELRVEIPGALEVVVMRLLARSPDQRYGSAGELLEELNDIRSAGIQPVQRTPRRALARPRRTGLAPLVAYLVGGSIVAAAGWGAIALWRDGSEPLDARLVAIAPFVNRTGEATLDQLGQMAAHWITHGLTEHSIVEVVGFSPDALPVRDQAALQSLAEQTGAGLVVSGSYYREGEDVLLVASITDATRRTVLRELGPVRSRGGGSLAAVEQLRTLVVGALAVHVDPTSPIEPGAGESPPTYEAYQAYLEGWGALMQSDWAAWKEAALRALALDSTFLQITGELTWAYLNLGECAAIDSVRRELEIRRDRVPEHVRLEVAQTAAVCRGDAEGSYRAAKRWVGIAPRSGHARIGLAVAAKGSGRLIEAVELFRLIDLTRGVHATNPWPYPTFMQVLHLVGGYQEELQVAEQARQQHPDFVWRFHEGLDGLAALGRTREIEARIAEVRPGNAIGPWLAADSYRDMADELSWHGHGAAAARFAARALEGYSRLPDAEQRTAFVRTVRAGALLHLERWTEMRAVLDSISLDEGTWLLGGAPPYANHGLVLALRGIAAAKSGDGAGARAALAGISRLPDSDGPGYLQSREFWEAQVLAALGEKEEALRRLEQGQVRGVLPRSNPQITHDEAGFRDLWHDPRFEALFAAR